MEKFILPRRGWLIEKIYAAFPHLASRSSHLEANTAQLDGQMDGWIGGGRRNEGGNKRSPRTNAINV